MRYGSICSGVAPQTKQWSALGLHPAWFAEIEPFPAAVLRHHFPEVPNLGDFTRIGVDAVLDHAHEQREGLRSESGRSGAAGDDIASRRGAGRRLRCGGAEVRPEEIQRGSIELLVGGTPCQSFSVAGLRGGLSDDRGNLALEFLRLAQRLRPRWVLWENVPGVLSSLSHDAPNPCPPPPPLDLGCDGAEVETSDEYDAEELHALNCFVAGLSELGYGWSMGVLDAEFFGVPQRRRRVFVVGCLGNWAAAYAVLFDSHSLSGDPPPRREKGEGVTRGVEIGPSGGSFTELSPTLDARAKDGFIRNQLGVGAVEVERTGDTRGQDAVVAQVGSSWDGGRVPTSFYGNGDGKDAMAVCFAADDYANMTFEETDCARPLTNSPDRTRAAPIAIRTAQTSANGHGIAEDVSRTLDGAQGQAVAFGIYGDTTPKVGEDIMPTLRGRELGGGTMGFVKPIGMAVRRLTPRECERLQGFSDDFTRIPWRGKPAEECPDGPRYKAIGNSWAVPVLVSIGKRLLRANAIIEERS